MNAPARPARSGVLAQVLTLLGGPLGAKGSPVGAQRGIPRNDADAG